jgi:DNA polymerase III delta prime subunit
VSRLLDFVCWTQLNLFSMTAGAQQALRRTMEIYSNTTRFCLACNMSNKIIEPIQSRCAILRYAKLKDQEILKRLLEICEQEKVCVFSVFMAKVTIYLTTGGI